MMQLFLLLTIFQLKHFLADYVFQTERHLAKFLPDWRFFWPLVDHCAIHAIMTLGILTAYGALHLWYLVIFDFVIHFTMDRIKASPNYLGRYKSLCSHDYQHREYIRYDKWNLKVKSNSRFWKSLGFDQWVHHSTHEAIACLIAAFVWGMK